MTKHSRPAVLLFCILALSCISCNVTVYNELFEEIEPPHEITVSSITPNSGTEPEVVIITDLHGDWFMPGAAVSLSRAHGYRDHTE